MIAKIKQKLKLLFISSDKFPPFRIDVAVLFSKELAGRGHQIDYLLQSDSDNPHFYQTELSGTRAFVGATNNGTILVHRLHKHILSVLNDLRSIRLVRGGQYDFIQVKDKFIAALIGIYLSKVTKTKFFFWLSFPFPEADLFEYRTGTARYPILYFIRGMFFKYLLYHTILPLSDHVFVQSEQMKKDIISQGIAEDKITPVLMGIDFDDTALAEESTEQAIKKENDSIIYLGTMQKVRRIDFVIRVFRKVLDEMPTVKLYMVGSSDNIADLDYLKGEAKRLCVDHAVRFTGNLPREQALQYVKRAAVGISPFFPTPILNSTSPTKLIEYMSLGIPVVANDHPEQRQVIAESEAGRCVPYNEDAFAAAILDLLRDTDNSVKMGEKGKEYVREVRNYSVIAESLGNKYYALLS